MKKIVHVCLVGPYSDGFSYQENILAKYHKRMGNDVSVITSTYSWDKNGFIQNVPANYYLDENGVMIYRLCKKKSIINKMAKYNGFFELLDEIKPDIIFCHGCNFADISTVRRFVKKNSCVLYFDNHCDSTNSGTNFLSKYFLHRIIWRHKVKRIERFVKKFYGVLPRRCDFLVSEYKVPREKVQLLIMGLDDDNAKSFIDPGLCEISIGGKIDEWKAEEIIAFLKAFNKYNIENNDSKIHITIYGSIVDSYKDEIIKFTKSKNIDYFGWASQEQIVEILSKSSYAVFPGRHSVLWEEAVGLGVPIVAKHIEGYDHVDIGGNVYFLTDSSVNYYKSVLDFLLLPETYTNMKKNAMSDKRREFLYSKISRVAIDEQ